MTPEDARAYLNYLLTLNLRREEAFGPLALTFLREFDLNTLGILPEEHFSLLIATSQAFAAEPKRYTIKLELLQKARQLLPQTRYFDPELGHQLDHDIRKTSTELGIYTEAMKGSHISMATASIWSRLSSGISLKKASRVDFFLPSPIHTIRPVL